MKDKFFKEKKCKDKDFVDDALKLAGGALVLGAGLAVLDEVF